MSDFEPMKHLIIKDLKILQAVAHPLRSQLLDLFGDGPRTVKQVADRLGMTSNKLYYHVNLLEQYGLLRVTETRTVGNMIEKLYRTTAERFEIDANLLSFSTPAGQEGAEQMVVSCLDATREDLLRSVEARRLQRLQGKQVKPREASVSRCHCRLSEARAEAFRERLNALVEEFAQADEGLDFSDGVTGGADDSSESDIETYALTVAFYVSGTFPELDDR